jgi:hypothetical protein
MDPADDPVTPTLPYAPRASRPWWRIVLPLAALLLLIYVAAPVLFSPLIGRANWIALHGRSVSNLQEIGLAARRFRGSHTGHWPDSFADLVSAEGLRTGALVSPASQAEELSITKASPTTREVAEILARSHVTYVYLGRGWTDGSVPADAVVAYEPAGIQDTGSAILFGDGHAEFVTTERAARLIAAASATTRPVSAGSVP